MAFIDSDAALGAHIVGSIQSCYMDPEIGVCVYSFAVEGPALVSYARIL